MMLTRRIVVVLLAFAATACVTKIKPTVSWNPPPDEAFSEFGEFELMPVKLSPAERGDGASQKALIKIQENVSHKLDPLLDRWEKRNDNDRRLIVEPVIEELKFVGGGKRFFAGALAGSSAVRMKVTFTDAETGEVIAEPEFYQRAHAYGGGWSVGGTDNAMLVRVSTVLREYFERNYDEAIGGPTGLESAQQG